MSLEYPSKEIFVPGVILKYRAPIDLNNLQIQPDSINGGYCFMYGPHIIRKGRRIGGGKFGEVFIFESADQKYGLAIKIYKGPINEPGNVHEKNISIEINKFNKQLSITKNKLMKVNDVSFLVMTLADGDIESLNKDSNVNLLCNKSILHILHSMSNIIVTLEQSNLFYTDLKPANILYKATRNDYIQIYLGDIGGLCFGGTTDYTSTPDFANHISENNLEDRRCNYLNSTWALLVMFFQSINYEICTFQSLLNDFNIKFTHDYQDIYKIPGIRNIYAFLYVTYLKKSISNCMKNYKGTDIEIVNTMHKYADIFQFIASDTSLESSTVNVSRIFSSMAEYDSSGMCADLTLLRYDLSTEYFLKALERIRVLITICNTYPEPVINFKLKEHLKNELVFIYVKILNQDNIWNTAIKNLNDCFENNNNTDILRKDIHSIFKLRAALDKYDLDTYSNIYNTLINM